MISGLASRDTLGLWHFTSLYDNYFIRFMYKVSGLGEGENTCR
jgi:hypothetical protein